MFLFLLFSGEKWCSMPFFSSSHRLHAIQFKIKYWLHGNRFLYYCCCCSIKQLRKEQNYKTYFQLESYWIWNRTDESTTTNTHTTYYIKQWMVNATIYYYLVCFKWIVIAVFFNLIIVFFLLFGRHSEALKEICIYLWQSHHGFSVQQFFDDFIIIHCYN